MRDYIDCDWLAQSKFITILDLKLHQTHQIINQRVFEYLI